MAYEINIKQLEKLITDFNRVASRLLKTDCDDGIQNTRRLLHVIECEPLIKEFIDKNNKTIFDIPKAIQERRSFQGYELPIIAEDEIAFVFQLLKYTAENRTDYSSICMLYNSSNKTQDHVDDFNRRVVHPFVQHIESYLRGIWIDMKEENKHSIVINNQSGQVSIAQNNSTINAVQTHNYNQLLDLHKQFKELISSLNAESEIKQEIEEIVDAAVSEVQSEKPKRSIIRMGTEKLKEVTQLGQGIAGLVEVADKMQSLLTTFIG